MVWIEFIAAASIITGAGVMLTIYADRLGEKLHISGAFVGLILLSIVSSLPELGTTFSVVAYLQSPDLAAGNIFGSNGFNMLILAIVDILLGSASLYALAKVNHNKSILLAGLMTFAAIAAIQSGGFGNVAGLPIDSALLLIIYIAGIWFLYQEEKKSEHPSAGGEKEPVWLEAGVVLISGIIVVGTGYWLANIGDEIQEVTGWGEGFIGHIFLAVTTSLPELIITITSLRLKAYDMAIANTVGSCFFNILMFPIVEPAYSGNLLANISPNAILPAAASLLMLLTVYLGLTLAKKSIKTGFIKYILIAEYLFASWVVFQ